MPWLKIDDRVRTHPKIVQAGPDAAWYWFCGICYCREHLTDGYIPKGMLASLCPGVNLSVAKRLVAALIREKLWHAEADGYQVHDFLDWNPSRSEVLKKRAEDNARKRGGKEPDSGMESDGNSVRSSDGIQKDSTPRAHVSAGAHGSGLGSGSGSGPGSEKSPRETKLRPIVQPPVRWKHGEHEHGFCEWMCLPVDLVDQLAERLARARKTSHTAERPRVLEWAQTVMNSGVIPTGKMYDFWNAQWAASGPQPTTAADEAFRKANDAALREIEETRRRHDSVRRDSR